MKPEDFEKLTPKQQQKYRENTADYRRNFARREAAKRTIPTYTERRQREYDAQAIDYDAFPESMLREWLRTNAPTMGACRQHTARWITTNAALSKFLQGARTINTTTLFAIQQDTGISMEKLMLDCGEAQTKHGL